MVATTTAIVMPVTTYAADVTLLSDSDVGMNKVDGATQVSVTVTVKEKADDCTWACVRIYADSTNTEDKNGNTQTDIDVSKTEAQTVDVEFKAKTYYQIGINSNEGGLTAELNKAVFKKADGTVVYTYDPALDTTPTFTKVSNGKYTFTAGKKAKIQVLTNIMLQHLRLSQYLQLICFLLAKLLPILKSLFLKQKLLEEVSAVKLV